MSEGSPRQFWKSLAERDGAAAVLEASRDEFPEPPAAAATPNRRDFLAAAGFAFTGTMLAGCGNPLPRAPVRQALPLVDQPENVTPGRALHYASSCAACSAGCGLLVKTRDGRPIKLEGNPQHPLSMGGLCAVGQASLLGLYDRLAPRQPLHQGQDSSWTALDLDIRRRLDQLRGERRPVRVLSSTITSPTLQAALQRFLDTFPDGRHIVYDALSSSSILEAHRLTHGQRLLPRYRFENAEVVVSFDADFLGTWISPVEFTSGYHRGRNLHGTPRRCSYHVQFESRLSLTGCKADQRVVLLPGEIGLVLTHLAERVAQRAGVSFTANGLGPSPVAPEMLDALADRLWAARRHALVVCGSPQIGDQVLCNFLNHLLGAYGTTLDVGQPSLQKQGDDRQLQELFQELRHDRIGAVILIDCNPVYDLPDGPEWANLLRRVPLTVACCERLDETTEAVQYVCPPPNYLASWGDAEPVRGLFSLTQPALRPLGNTRPVLECLAAWLGTQQSAYAQIRGHWETHLFPHQNEYATFQEFWDHAVHDGFVEIETERPPDLAFALGTVRPVLRATRLEGGNFALVLYPKVGLLDGRHAYNPWLQELPDPVTKATWDNYACLSPATAARLGLTEGDVVRLEASGGGSPLELPVLIQPGQHDQVVAIALGYGSKASERFAGVGPQWLEARPTLGPNGRVGVNAAPLKKWQDGTLAWVRNQATITRTQRRQPIASTQTHHTLNVPAGMVPPGQERRPIIQETTVRALAGPPQPPAPLAPQGRGVGGEGAIAGPRPAEPDLWPNDHPVTGPRWGMVIDLNACTGCSACVLACQVENNIPVVGKDEVQRHREMHWLRIDRYFATPPTPPSQGGDRGSFTPPLEGGARGGDVDVAFQPMLCQHCGNAPCETVCPVLATVHSSEGLNQQVYNRCVGTRYCANNCPYKVRRFNWFDYPHDDSLHNLVLNPDVTVRSRGVMEKCTFCVQRIQEAKYEARRRGLPLADDMIQTACQQSCPARAIVFGDLNDPASKVSGQMRDPRRYQVLTELNVRPSVSYLKVVRNRTADQGGDGRG